VKEEILKDAESTAPKRGSAGGIVETKKPALALQ
jgi:hypothetical protein